MRRGFLPGSLLLVACSSEATEQPPQQPPQEAYACSLEPLWSTRVDAPTDEMLESVHATGDAAIVHLSNGFGAGTIARIEAAGASWQLLQQQSIVHAMAVNDATVTLTTSWSGLETDEFGCALPNDLCLVQHDALTGAPLWTKSFAGVGTWRPYVAVDGSANIVFSASHTTPVDFGGGMVSGGTTLVGLDATGNYRYAVSLGGADIQIADLSVHDPSNDVLVFFGWNYQVHVARFAENGELRWDKAFSGCGNSGCGIGSIDSDAAGNVYVGGDALETNPEFGADRFFVGAYVVKLDPMGNHVWSRSYSFADARSDDCQFGVTAAGFVANMRSTRQWQEAPNGMSPTTIRATRELSCLAPSGTTLDDRVYLDAITGNWNFDTERAALDSLPDGRLVVAVRSAYPVDLGSGPIQGPVVVGALRLSTP